MRERLQAVTDGRGQLLAIADSSGFITAEYAGSGHDQSSWQGAGLTTQAQTFDPRKWETNADWGGIQQFRNRAYDPATGTWIQEDPMGVAGGVNLYRFNNGNPVSFGDPFGLCPEDAGGEGKTDRFDDCPEGSSGWYANRIAKGEGNGTLNEIGGALAACGESFACNAVVALAGPVAGGVTRLAGAAGVARGAAGFADPKFAAQLEGQLAKDGPQSVLKSLRSLEKRLAQHQAKLPGLNFKSSVEREIRTFQNQIDTLKEFIRQMGLKP